MPKGERPGRKRLFCFDQRSDGQYRRQYYGNNSSRGFCFRQYCRFGGRHRYYEHNVYFGQGANQRNRNFKSRGRQKPNHSFNFPDGVRDYRFDWRIGRYDTRFGFGKINSADRPGPPRFLH